MYKESCSDSEGGLINDTNASPYFTFVFALGQVINNQIKKGQTLNTWPYAEVMCIQMTHKFSSCCEWTLPLIDKINILLACIFSPHIIKVTAAQHEFWRSLQSWHTCAATWMHHKSHVIMLQQGREGRACGDWVCSCTHLIFLHKQLLQTYTSLQHTPTVILQDH